MASDNQELLERLGPLLNEFREHGLNPTLFGGLAVHLQAAAAAGDEQPERVWDDPRFLTRMVRPTRDIDLALFEESTESVRSVLADLGFRADGVVHKRDRDSVDAVQAIASGRELEALLALLASEVETLGTRTDLLVMGKLQQKRPLPRKNRHP